METMKYITVLDFETGEVCQYDIGFQVNKLGWNPEAESIEDFLNSVGHNLTNCEWMIHSDSEIVSRKAQWTRFPITN